MNKVLTDDFVQYMTEKYGAKGRRAIRFADRIDVLDILLGVKNSTDFDEDDKKFLSQEQLDELERLGNRLKDSNVCMERDKKKNI
jgi:hypothetical protein